MPLSVPVALATTFPSTTTFTDAFDFLAADGS